jgi:hypothetical protein
LGGGIQAQKNGAGVWSNKEQVGVHQRREMGRVSESVQISESGWANQVGVQIDPQRQSIGSHFSLNTDGQSLFQMNQSQMSAEQKNAFVPNPMRQSY